jgi:DNA-binding NtrC family response regulator
LIEGKGAEFNKNILIITENRSLTDFVESTDVRDYHDLHFCRKRDNIFYFLKNNRIKTVLMNSNGDEQWELKLLKLIKIFDPIIEIIVVGPAVPSDKAMEWINQGATDYLIRPLRMSSLRSIFARLEEKRSLRIESYLLGKELEKKYVFQGLVGKSPFMLEIFSFMESIAKYFSTVLITGETGVGKEMVATAIYHLSPVKDRKFVVCDCVSVPENLFESELFGYAKGAFTGAYRNKRGLFEEADGGVIFLDEIAEIPLSIQGKLLRVIETHQFRPLGFTDNRNVEVRVIAATNRDLREMVNRGRFREDLFYRLNKVEVHLPPLRNRLEDVPLLVGFFLDKYSEKFGKQVKGVARQVQKLFLTYSWPGNVRELENIMERALLVSKKEFIDIIDLPDYIQKYLATEVHYPFFNRENIYTLRNLESEYISYLMKSNDNNIRKTAMILNVSRSTLYRKLEKYNIDHCRSEEIQSH